MASPSLLPAAWHEIRPCWYKRTVLHDLVCLCIIAGVVNYGGEEFQIYQFGSNFPLGTFVPTIVQSAMKNPASTEIISPLVIEITLPGSCTLIFTPATASLEPLTTHCINGWRGVFDSISACSLLGNGSCGSFCGYMRNNFQRELFTTTKAYPSKISDCGGKNFTSMEIKLAALIDFEAGCDGKFIAALTDSMRKFKKYSRKSGYPDPMPKSSATIVGIDEIGADGAFADNIAVAFFEPQLVESGIESHCVKSGNTLPFTRSFTNAFMFKIGRFVGSIFSPILYLSLTSITANTTATMISIVTPAITHFSPYNRLRCLSRYSPTSENHSFFGFFSSLNSSHNPQSKTPPPNAAKNEKMASFVQSDDKMEDRKFAVMWILFGGIPLLAFISFAAWIFYKVYRIENDDQR